MQKDSVDTTSKTTQMKRCTAKQDLTENMLCETMHNCSVFLPVLLPIKKCFKLPVLTKKAKNK